MPKLHVFIDGSWLIKVSAPSGVLASRMQNPQQFKLDFPKLKTAIFNHVRSSQPDCTEIGDCFFITSIFDLPIDFSNWSGKIVNGSAITQNQIGQTMWNVNMRRDYADRAIDAGFERSAIISVPFKDWMISKLANGKYQEKQVDTTVVALLVKYAITKTDDFFAIVAGDSDMLPAIKIAYPEFTKRLCLVTNHPDQLHSTHRQTAFSFLQYTYLINPLYLHDCVDKITEGTYVYVCANCNKVFIKQSPIPHSSRPYCTNCQQTRT